MIIAELHCALPVEPSGQINEVHRYRIVQNDRPVFAFGNRPLNADWPPALFAPQQKGGELDRFFYANASVREGADLPPKQCPRGCIVEVDTVRIREHELDAAQRISRPGILAQ